MAVEAVGVRFRIKGGSPGWFPEWILLTSPKDMFRLSG